MTPHRYNARPRRDVRPGLQVRSQGSRPEDGGSNMAVYNSLLAEAEVVEGEKNDERPLKKRRVAAAVRGPHTDSKSTEERGASTSAQFARRQQQTVENSSSSDESDFGFEDVDLSFPADPSAEPGDAIKDLSISVGPSTFTKNQSPSKRKAASKAEKAHRLLIHKLHVLCLIGHCLYVNGRCNNETAQKFLRPLLTDRMVSFLNPKAEYSQHRQKSTFMDGLDQTAHAFKGKFRVTSSGMCKPRWNSEEDGIRDIDSGEAIDRSDFINAAKTIEGSQDLGNQLFCALLRSVGVDARLVCSLQPLPFTNLPKSFSTPKSNKQTAYTVIPKFDTSPGDSSADNSTRNTTASGGDVSAPRRRLENPRFSVNQTPSPKKLDKPVRKLAYPVFWVEAFNKSHQEWIPLDPLVTNTINKASKLEPIESYKWNQMTYVIAFEANGVARDVTKRYAKAYNAKTRGHRLDSTGDEGSKWWKAITRLFRRPGGPIDREGIEDAFLSQREMREPMPKNIQDFKNHPYLALKRHLKRYEVLYPNPEVVGPLNTGTAAKPNMESVYRRSDVQVCRSADQWFRHGRQIKQGEQPAKHIQSRRKRNQALDQLDDAINDGQKPTALYAQSQTELYVPPPVKRGRVPRNNFGNLDVYVPSMVPAGGIHIRHSLAKKAAGVLRIDCVDAVVGFQFKGSHGTAVVDGVVIPQKYAEAVRAAIEGFEDDILDNQSRARSFEALCLWKRFLTGLKIRERVRSYGAGSEGETADSETSEHEVERDADASAGGFISEAADEAPLPTAGQFSIDELVKASKKRQQRKPRAKSFDEEEENDTASDSGWTAGEELDDEEYQQSGSPSNVVGGGGFLPESDQEDASLFGGSFSPNDDANEPEDSQGGGFLLEDNIVDNQVPENGILQGTTLEMELESSKDSRMEQTTQDAEPPSDIDDMGIERSETTDNRGAFKPVDNATSTEVAMGDVNVGSVGLIGDKFCPEKEYAAETGSDQGSMLSHDPEDEDLEPDWLESD